MQINKINNTNFEGFYKIPNSAKTISELESHILPTYKYIRKQPIRYFEGKPLIEVQDLVLELVSRSLGYSKSWLVANARNHGVDIDDSKDEILVVSGEKDNENLSMYFLTENKKFIEKTKKENSLWGRISKLIKEGFEPTNESPTHIRLAEYIKNVIDHFNEGFEEEFGNKIKSVKTLQDLIFNIMTEE